MGVLVRALAEGRRCRPPAPAGRGTGAWPKAAGAAAEALPLAVGTGHPGPTALPTAQLALVAALRGDDVTDRHLDKVTEIRDKHPVGITDGLVAD
ncbi:hypothetical protein [Streptomyces sp. NPDC001275]